MSCKTSRSKIPAMELTIIKLIYPIVYSMEFPFTKFSLLSTIDQQKEMNCFKE